MTRKGARWLAAALTSAAAAVVMVLYLKTDLSDLFFLFCSMGLPLLWMALDELLPRVCHKTRSDQSGETGRAHSNSSDSEI